MENNEGRRSEIEIHGLSLIDVSSEDDSLLFSSFLDPISNEFSVNDKDDNVLGFLGDPLEYDEKIPVSTLEEKEEVLQPRESPEPEKLMKSGKYNLRKSLAWDNAFFTSAGVLEPDELSSMIESNHKAEKQNLSTIQEDLQRSTESISTLQSDCTLENSQEFVFFEDIRASIQRSAIASGAATPHKSQDLVATDAAISPMSSMVEDHASQEKMRPKASPKKPSIRAQGIGKATKQPVAARGLSTKPPKVVSRVRPMSTTSMKRASLDVNKTKQEQDSKLAGGKQPLGSRISISKSARPVLPRPAASSKSSLRSSVASKNELTSSCSSLESCASASSSVSHKSFTNSTRKKNDSSSRLNSPLANKNIPRAALRNVTQPRIPPLSTNGTSKSKLSSNVSPASSISDWSSESSQASTPNRMVKTVSGASNNRAHTIKPLDNSNDARHDSRVDEFVHEGTKQRVSAVNGGVVHPASMNPTGLRVPSPKIGFFDGVKSNARVPTGRSSALLSGLPKQGVNSPNGPPAKTTQPARLPLQESSNCKTKGSNNGSRSGRVVSISSPNVQKKMYLKISAEEQWKGEKSSPSSGSRGKQTNGLPKETVKLSPANAKLKSSCIELPNETSDNSAIRGAEGSEGHSQTTIVLCE